MNFSTKTPVEINYCNLNDISNFNQHYNNCSDTQYNCVIRQEMETDRSKAVLLLWIIYGIYALFCYAFVRVCLLVPRDHLLGKG